VSVNIGAIGAGPFLGQRQGVAAAVTAPGQDVNIPRSFVGVDFKCLEAIDEWMSQGHTFIPA